MSIDIVLHIIAAFAYLFLGGSILIPLMKEHTLSESNKTRYFILLLSLILHGLAIHLKMIHPNHLELNWSLGLSMTLWLGVLIFWLESYLAKVIHLLLPITLLAAIASLTAVLFPSNNKDIIVISSEIFRFHLIISLFAYSLIGLATLQAIVTALLDKQLRNPLSFSQKPSLINRLIDLQPPLMVQEQLLFRVIWVGFILLTLSVLTGFWVSLDIHNQLIPFDHKSIFTLIAWLVFAFLLLGRSLWGWRGRTALRWTLSGFILLVLAYTGSQFIIEVILQSK